MTALMEYPDLMFEDATTLQIRTYPNPCLTEVCEPIAPEEFGPEIEKIGKRMIELASWGGFGLAASQVGLLKRMFVMQFPNEKHDPQEPAIICNPIIEMSEEGEFNKEGCLSLPGITEQVWRSTEVHMRYQTPYGEEKAMVLLDLEARIAQHEVDHLDGIVFVQHLNRQQRRAALARYEKLQRRR